jgi:hypothetical protein
MNWYCRHRSDRFAFSTERGTSSLTSTATAPQQAGQQRRPVVGSSYALPTMIVRGNRPLDLLELLPADVSFMGVWKQDEPPLPRFASGSLSLFTIVIADDLLAPAIGVGATVCGISQHIIYDGVPRTLPANLS